MPYGLIGIALVVGLITACFFNSTASRIANSLFGFVVALLVLLLVVGFPIDRHGPREAHQVNSLKLVSVKDGSKIEGSFWLGSGSINEKNQYYFYYELEGGGIKQWHVSVDVAVIYEDDDLKNEGELKIFDMVLSKPWIYFSVSKKSQQYKLRVPRGTVIRQFALDLQ